MMQRIKVPEDVFRQMVKPADGRRQKNWVEIAVDADGLVVRFERTSEMREWSRKAYDEAIAAEQRQVKRSVL